jgi:hypothetical protein
MRPPPVTKSKAGKVKSLGHWPRGTRRCLRPARFMLGAAMAQKRSLPHRVLTMHEWEAKHYVLAAVIILVVMGMFAYSWS